MGWITDEYGNEQWSHAGWMITIYTPGTVGRPIFVRHVDNEVDVEVEQDTGEISVYADEEYGAYAGPGPARACIPIPVMRAIIEAYDTVQSRITTG